jgi:hypothetical protein
MASYRKRQRAYEGESNRAAAIKRMRDSASVTRQMARLRPVDSGPRSHGGSPGPPGPKTVIPKSQQPTQKGPPQEQLAAAHRAYRRAGSERQIADRTHGADIRQARLGSQVSRQLGNIANRRIAGHRMPLWRALSRRSTDSSRARVLSKYGVTRKVSDFNFTPSRPARGRMLPRERPGSLRSGDKGPMRDGGTYGGALNRVAQMRAKANRQRMMHLPQARRRRVKPRSVNV